MINFQPSPYGQMQMPYTFNPYQMGYQPSQQVQTQSSDPQIIYCDGIDYVKSQNVRMDGQGTFYAKTDGSEIYCKKLKADGSSKIETYIKTIEEDNDCSSPKININDVVNDIKSSILSINTAISDMNNKIQNVASSSVSESSMSELKSLVENLYRQPEVPVVIDAVPQKKGVFK